MPEVNYMKCVMCGVEVTNGDVYIRCECKYPSILIDRVRSGVFRMVQDGEGFIKM